MKNLLSVLLCALAAVLSAEAQSQRSDSLFAAGVNYYNEGCFGAAATYFREVCLLDRDVAPSRAAYGVHWLASSLFKMGREEEASQLTYLYKLEPIDRRLTVETDSLGEVYFALKGAGKTEEALEMADNVARLEKRRLGANSYFYANSLYNCGDYSHELGRYKEALTFFKEADSIYALYGDVLCRERMMTCHALCVILRNLGSRDEAAVYGQKSVAIAEKLMGKHSREYLHGVLELANVSDETMAIRLAAEADSISDYIVYKDWSEEIELRSILGALCYKIGNYERAKVHVGQENRLCRENGKDDDWYLISLNNYAEILKNTGDDITEVKKARGDYLDGTLRLHGENSIAYADALYRSADDETGDKKIDLLRKAIEIYESQYAVTDMYLCALRDIAFAYWYEKGEFTQAYRYQQKCVGYLRTSNSVDPGFASSLYSNLIGSLNSMGQNEKALELIDYTEKLLSDCREPWAEERLTEILFSKASTLFALKRYDEAVELYRELCGHYEQFDNSPLTPILYSGLANALLHSGWSTEAKQLSEKALKLLEEIPSGIKYTELLPAYLFGNRLATDQTDGLDKIVVQLEDLLKRDDINIGYKMYIAQLLGVYDIVFANDVPKATAEFKTFLDYYQKHVGSNIDIAVSQERADLWTTLSNALKESIDMILSNERGNAFADIVYEMLLNYKGRLLDIDCVFDDLVRRLPDQEVREAYSRYRMAKLTEGENREKITAMEADLARLLKDKGISISGRSGKTVQDLLDNMHRGDVAVEFYFNTYALKYYAVVLRPEAPAPSVIELDIADDDFGGDTAETAISSAVWKDVLAGVGEGVTVYFSPSGILHSQAIEYLPCWDGSGRLLCDVWKMRRLTSTREIAMDHDYRMGKGAVYGGLNYNGIELDDEAMEKLELQRGELASFLPGTAEEADFFEECYVHNHMEYRAYRLEKGTSQSFKALPADSIRILHLGTHGFYNKNYLDLQSSKDAPDAALLNSGLLFSGANMQILGILDNVISDDCILTARDIANLDFSSVRLAVISACESGLGDVDAGEGVFGLQRGFKKAGVQSLIMSLWKVDDAATAIFMKRFYENWLMENKDIHSSFDEARKYLRTYRDERNPDKLPYADRKYWGAFVLLDAPV